MSNIFNNSRNLFDMILNKSNYWDFNISLNYNGEIGKNADDCLINFIDTANPDCIWFNDLISIKDYKWEGCVNNGVELNSIGYTGVDNGIIRFEKDSTSNKEFLKLYTKGRLNISSNDFRLKLQKIDGNNNLYDYSNNIVEKDNMIVSELNGGFYQGFFKTKDQIYQILPDTFDDGWTFNFVLNKSSLNNGNITLNDKHPNNKGIFFYMGTRSENKWWKYYMTPHKFERIRYKYGMGDYVDESYLNNDDYSVDYSIETVKKPYISEPLCIKYDTDCCQTDTYFTDNYVKSSYLSEYYEYFVDEGYLSQDDILVDNISFSTSEGYDLYQPNIREYRITNKFVTYNHTKEGLNINKEEPELILYDIDSPNMENYFLLFNQTKEGYNINSINTLLTEKSKYYNVIDDITGNAIAFRITDEGKLGYRYIVKDCESDEGYSIKEDYSVDGLIKEDRWYSINVVFKEIKTNYMQLLFYVDGKLKLVSQDLPKINFRPLNDLYSKQEGVPFNISIGGGTQGLCDVIYHDYRNLPEYMLPIEKYFAGSFIGYFKEFKFYNCPLTFNQLKNKE